MGCEELWRSVKTNLQADLLIKVIITSSFMFENVLEVFLSNAHFFVVLFLL